MTKDKKAELNINLATVDDVDAIMKFINTEWSADHVLSKSKKIFLHQYLYNKKLNFVVARNKFGEICAILGFIFPNYEVKNALWLSLWKVSDSKNTIPNVGIQLLLFLKKKFRSIILCSGISENTFEIYKYLGFNVAKLNQYFLINEEIKHPKLYKKNKEINYKKNINESENKMIPIEEILKEDYESLVQSYFPSKSYDYFLHRYVNHPVYSYEIYGIYSNSILVSLIVTRECSFEKSLALRVVDVIGGRYEFNDIAYGLTKIMHNLNYEYVDLLNYGIDSNEFLNAGFSMVDICKKDLILPNYYEPFVRENKEIFICFEKSYENITFFKADGDQDRPNWVFDDE